MSGSALRVTEVTWMEKQAARRTAAPQTAVDPTQKKGVGRVGLEGAPSASMEAKPERKPSRSEVYVPDSALGFYRRYTEVFLRRYMQLSLRMGQVPSVLGSCVFRGRVSSRPVNTFEDSIALVIDVERCMKKLTGEDRQVIARVAMQEYTQEEAAELLGMSHRTLVRRYAQAMDALTRILLDAELLNVEKLFPGQ